MGENYRPLVRIKCLQRFAEEYEPGLNHASRVV